MRPPVKQEQKSNGGRRPRMRRRNASAPGTEETPLRRQYLEVKSRFPDAVVLFRLGDFYETFDEDARVVSEALEIVLTSREMGKGQRVPMAGIPHHALDGYLARLIRQGHRVAICEQTSDPATSPGLVDREVVRVVTPGTVVEPALLEGNAPNYLAAVILDGQGAGLAYADITTSTYATAHLLLEQVPLELERLAPAETLVPRGQNAFFRPGTTTDMEPSAFDLELATERILRHFGTATLEPFGCQGVPLAVQAAGAILAYLEETQRGAVGQLASLHTYSAARFMALDPQTRRNLELFHGGRFGAGPSLLGVLDFAQTPMGGRLLREWLGQPLLNVDDIRRRQDAVEWLVRSAAQREETRRSLRTMADLERLVNRIRGSAAQPRELQALRRTLEAVPRIRELVGEAEASLAWLRDGLHPCTEVVELVANAIVDEPTVGAGNGETIRAGLSPELDELREARRDARTYVAGLEAEERTSTGIPSLKVGYNRVFGYYLEVTRPHLSRVPTHYVRRQTLVNAERFITPELKEYESRILNAQERIAELESALFQRVCRQIAESSGLVLEAAGALAQVDVLAALAEAAFRNDYTRPVVDESDSLEIQDGRHPIVERALPTGSFVPNETTLSNEDCSVMVLTGPNMAGKSTYIRQVALIVLMAQIGSFVPASSARIGLVDRIFTRVGLQDDLATGQSTFMVEMVETASILHHATRRSLVVLDEIGRGTSTYDGLAIAHAVAEFIHNHPRLGCKTLFATHYHELADLATSLPRACNYNVAVSEEEGNVVFLRHIIPGAADRSYGVHVAQIAGLPNPVVTRATELLAYFEAHAAPSGVPAVAPPARRPITPPALQLGLFNEVGDALLRRLESLDISSMTPLDALNALHDLQQRAKELDP